MKTNNEWVCTDPNCNQYRKDISDKIFLFKEDRLINPMTKEVELYEAEIDLDYYTLTELIECCNAYGYDENTIIGWLNKGFNLDLIAEWVFEMDMDNYY